MTRINRAAVAAISVLCLATSVPAAAQQRTVVTAHVVHRDLDLSILAGRAILDARVKDAARLACGAPLSLIEQADTRRCTREMLRDAAVKSAAIVARHDVQLASVR